MKRPPRGGKCSHFATQIRRRLTPPVPHTRHCTWSASTEHEESFILTIRLSKTVGSALSYGHFILGHPLGPTPPTMGTQMQHAQTLFQTVSPINICGTFPPSQLDMQVASNGHVCETTFSFPQHLTTFQIARNKLAPLSRLPGLLPPHKTAIFLQSTHRALQGAQVGPKRLKIDRVMVVGRSPTMGWNCTQFLCGRLPPPHPRFRSWNWSA